MAMGPRLQFVQRQSLVMTPQLQQAIKLLQMSQIELASYIEQELEGNPLLAEGARDEDAGAPEPPAAAPDAAPDTASALADREAPVAEMADTLGEQWGEEFSDRGGDGMGYDGPAAAPGSGGGVDLDDDRVRDIADGRGATLLDHLLAQISLDFREPAERLIAMHLTEKLDEAGYLRDPPETVAAELGATLAQVEAVRARLRRIDPPGLYCRTLAECLGAQLAERNRLDPAMQTLLDNLDLLGRREIAALKRRCGVDDEDLSEMIGEIRSLDPKPGLSFEGEPVRAIVPDVLLRRAPKIKLADGEISDGWRLELNSTALPRVLVDRRYHATLARGARDKPAKEFLSERLQAANWLVKALDQRAVTVLKVAREIVRQQDGFFVHGVGALRPLVLRDIAIACELHESTVSRVTSNKYIETPRGTFELKYFFTTGLPASSSAVSGAAVSSESVRRRIRALIEREPPSQPLSDDRLVELLHGEGVEIARRTVAKYRDALRIPSSAQRRRDKMMAALAQSAAE
jgi:RNA polymerase sigma-54 factor